MAQVITQNVFKPNPGADMSKLNALIAESAAIWRKHGAEVSIWAVSVGEIGNMVFACRYDSTRLMANAPMPLSPTPLTRHGRPKPPPVV